MSESDDIASDDVTASLVKEFHKSGNWQGVVQLYDNGFSDEKFLWFRPQSEGIKFLVDNLTNIGVEGVSSIGCGTGLLEWIISLSSGLPVIGYEIDKEWWESRYSPPTFWNNIKCVEPSTVPDLDPHHALLFCYFNNFKTFEAYLGDFTGNYVILIGPNEENRIRYCDPQPFELARSKQWHVHNSWRSSKLLEAIVFYKRSPSQL